MKWKVGDWCYHEYKLSRVERVNDNGEVTAVTTGYITTSTGGKFDVFPLTLRNKIVSESVEKLYNDISRGVSRNGLNWPHIHNYFCTHWESALNELRNYEDPPLEKDEKRVNEIAEVLYDTLKDFNNQLDDKYENTSVNGVRLFR